MYTLNNFRNSITLQLKNIGVLAPYVNTTLEIKESELTGSKIKYGEDLIFVEIQNLPNDIWVFENEITGKTQKKAFASAGSKVEQTIIWYNKIENRFYLCLLEMKTTLSVDMFSKVFEKIIDSTNFISIFLAANPTFTEIKQAEIYIIGICCYNYLNADISVYNQAETTAKDKAKRDFENEFIKKKKYEFTTEIDPVILDKIFRIPILLYENPNQIPRVTKGFQIDFSDIIKRATTITVAPIPPKTTIFQ